MIVNIHIDKIKANPWQTRLGENQEHILELAEDIKANGLMQPPVGRFVGEFVELAFGHNRWAAFKFLAKASPVWAEMPVDVRTLGDEQMAIQAWSENEKRRDVTAIERAKAIEKRIDDFRWTHEQVAEKLGVSRPMVSNALRLLRLPEQVQGYIQDGDLSERQAQALLPLYDLDPDLVAAHKYQDSIDLIVNMALGGMASDEIRQKVQTAVDWFKELVQPKLVAPAPAQEEIIEESGSDVPMPEDPSSPAQAESPAERFRKAMEARQAINGPAERVDPPAAKAPEQPAVQTPAAPAPVAPVAAPAPVIQPLTWEQSTIVVTITLTPVNGGGNRAAMIGLRANNGAPAMRFCQAADVDLSSPVIVGLMDEIRSKF